MKKVKLLAIATLSLGMFLTSCDGDDGADGTNGTDGMDGTDGTDGMDGMDGMDGNSFVGAVYAMTNGEGQVQGTNVQGPNTIIAYGRSADGSLTPIGPNPTGGMGGDYDGAEGLDPLISSNSLTKTPDNTSLLAVNAGSNTITAFNIQDDYSLEIAGESQPTGAVGPNSIAFTARPTDDVKGLVYVSNITRAEFLDLGEPGHQGTITGFMLMADGTLSPIAGSTRELENRPTSVQISPDGQWLTVTSLNAGAAGLGSGNQDEIVVYSIGADGLLSASPTGTGTSTLRDNDEGRNLPTGIGTQIVGDNYVVVTEAREFQPDGTPPAFPLLQDGSVSTWQIQSDGSLTPITLDVRSGEGNTGRTACWLDFTLDGRYFFVANAVESGIASYSFDNGAVALLDQTAAVGTGTGGADNGPDAFARTDGFIDMWITDDGQFLYQLFGLDGSIGIFRINGQSLQQIGKESDNLPDTNTQGIVAI